MSSNCLPAHHVFFSTHNALANGVDREEEEKLTLRVTQLGHRRESTIKFSAYPFYDIEMVKRLIIKRMALPPSTNISELRVFQRGSELPNHRSLSAFANKRPKIHFYWCFRDSTPSVGIRPLELRAPPALQSLMGEVNLGLQRGINPKLTMDGTGGTYMLFNSKGQRVAMFKPQDEEAFAPNNPRSYEGHFGQKGFRSGVLSGEGASREVAAFLLDAQHGGLAGVPQTTKVEARHPGFCHKIPMKEPGIRSTSTTPPGSGTFWKQGSLQEFVDAKDTCGDYDPKVFSIRDAHYIGILDIIVLNLDRNDGNILVTVRPINGINAEASKTPDGKPSKFRLIPIDHGLILPDTMDVGDVDLIWFHWPQSKLPFTTAELHHILSLDGDKDAHRLARKLEIREECLRTMRVTTRVLQMGARMHLNLFQIANLLVRVDNFEQPSIMERAVRTALAQAYTAVSASGLIQQSRLSGNGMFIDLHMTEKAAQNILSGTAFYGDPFRKTNNYEDTVGTKHHDKKSRAVTFYNEQLLQEDTPNDPMCNNQMDSSFSNISPFSVTTTTSAAAAAANPEVLSKNTDSDTKTRITTTATEITLFSADNQKQLPSSSVSAQEQDSGGNNNTSLKQTKQKIESTTAFQHLLELPSGAFSTLCDNSKAVSSSSWETSSSSSSNSTCSSNSNSNHSNNSSRSSKNRNESSGSEKRALCSSDSGGDNFLNDDNKNDEAAEVEKKCHRAPLVSRISGVPLDDYSYEAMQKAKKKKKKKQQKATALVTATSESVNPIPAQNDINFTNKDVNSTTNINSLNSAQIMAEGVGVTPGTSTFLASNTLDINNRGVSPKSKSSVLTNIPSPVKPTLLSSSSVSSSTRVTAITSSEIGASVQNLASSSTTFRRKSATIIDSDTAGGGLSSTTTRSGTARRRPTALHRRGTSSRLSLQASASCTWTLVDSHKRAVAVDWCDPLFEKTFFECFELIIKHHILDAHPDWRNYPFNGHGLLQEHENLHSSGSRRQQQHHYSSSFSHTNTAPMATAVSTNIKASTTTTTTAKPQTNAIAPVMTSTTTNMTCQGNLRNPINDHQGMSSDTTTNMNNPTLSMTTQRVPRECSGDVISWAPFSPAATPTSFRHE